MVLKKLMLFAFFFLTLDLPDNLNYVPLISRYSQKNQKTISDSDYHKTTITN